MHNIRTRAMVASACLTMGLIAVPASAQVPSDAVAYWKFDDATSPGLDSAGSYTATLFGDAAITNGKNKFALNLDGNDDYAKVSAANGLETASFAISAWVNCTLPSDTNGGEIVSLGDNYGLRVRNTGVARVFAHDTSTHWLTADSTSSVCDGAWHNLVGQFDDSTKTLKLYIDGAVAQSATTTTPISYTTGAHDLFIGHHGNGSTIYDFKGRLDQIRMYSRALNDADVAALDAEAPKVLTWNLRKGRATNNSDSINGTGTTVSSFVKYVGADVLLLSAVENQQEATDLKNQLGGSWDVDWHKSDNSNEGQAILSRFDMPTSGGSSDRDVFQVTQAMCGGSENQVIVFDTVVINGVRYSFFAIDQQDGSGNGTVRSCQSTQFRNWITSKNTSQPRLVAGDFNTDSDAGLTNWTSPTDGYFDGWPTALTTFGYAAEGSSQGNTTGRTKKTALDHILYSKTSGITPEAAQVWDTRFLYPGTTCGNISADSFLQVCSVPCSSCAYVDDKSVRPSDHIPFTLTISR